jgi:hypothetical protein
MTVTAPDRVVALAQEAAELRERIARKEDDPRARLADIESELERHWDAEHERRQQAQAEFDRILAEYEIARNDADEATCRFVDTVVRASELRRKLEIVRRRAGLPAPPSTSVRASRDRAFRELRQESRRAGGAVY